MIVLAFLVLGWVSQEPPPAYDELFAIAAWKCFPRAHRDDVKYEILSDLIDIEEAFFASHPQIPRSLRGMLLAAACRESRFNARARGDWRTRKGRRIAMAHGVVQLWPWWEKKYGINRDDPKASGHAWLTQIVQQYEKNQRLKRCPANFSEERKWVVAWVQTTRGGRLNRQNRYRCFQIPSHYKTLKKWRKIIEDDRDERYGPCR
jgi:hypothetical protein